DDRYTTDANAQNAVRRIHQQRAESTAYARNHHTEVLKSGHALSAQAPHHPARALPGWHAAPPGTPTARPTPRRPPRPTHPPRPTWCGAYPVVMGNSLERLLRARHRVDHADPRIDHALTRMRTRPASPDEAYWQAALRVAKQDERRELAQRHPVAYTIGYALG